MSDGYQGEEISCDLCIVGAGIAGLNALFAASRHLSRQQKIVIVDRNPAPGGMWHTAYSYVRLHQPHPMFTAGNIAWTDGRAPSYLASRDEVVAHLQRCFEICRQAVTLDARFGCVYRSHEEPAAGADVIVECVSAGPDAEPLRIRTKRLVKAFGYDIQTNDPLPVASSHVRSISPNDFDIASEELRTSTTPIYVVGAGKTGMDTAHELMTRYPQRKVSLVVGQGMLFLNRDQQFPSGLRRWWSGATPLGVFLDLAQRFDGRNETEVIEHMRRKYTLSLVPDARHFSYGLLSRAELATIARGSHEIIRDYLVDVEDRDGRPTMLLRSGATRAIEPGSWLINCTGYFSKRTQPYEPYLSAGGRVLTIHPASSIHLLSTVSAYLLVHLWFSGELHSLPLYEIDTFELRDKSREVSTVIGGSLMLYNMMLIMRRLPKSVLDEFGTDTARWYPLTRRVLDFMRMMRYQKKHPDHLQRSLDLVRERFDIRCGPLPHVARA
ncbi:MAG: hypothetical protein RL701_2384 [Pseudomonadota bacterium]|jgi:ribulose 1,5-bisphosphate synthetase/thiazole synthase